MMNMEEEDDLLSYTPLKRRKIGSGASTNNSPLNYSQVQERHLTKLKKLRSQTSRNQNQSQCSQNLSKTQISNVSKLSQTSRNQNQSQCSQNLSKTQISNVSKLSTSKNKDKVTSFKRPLVKKKEDKNILYNKVSSRVNLDSDFSVSEPKTSYAKPNLRNKTNESNGLKEMVKGKNEPNNTNFTNIFDDNIPDINLSQVIDSSSYSSDEGRQSVPLKKPKENELIEANFLNNSKNPADISKWTDLVSPSDDTENDFFNVKDPVQSNYNRVDSWLQSSINKSIITPIKIDVKNRIPHENMHDSTDNENQEKDDYQNSKTCIHLHFHVNSPKKFIQPTLDYYFKKSSCSLTPAKTVSTASLERGHNKEDVLKTWNNIMNSKKNNKPGPSNSNQPNKNVSNVLNKPERSSVSTKKCPFYKYVEDTSFVVDGFSYGHLNGVTSYFLSHFHYDHYRGLSKKFQKIIYCSQITANLVRLKLYVEEKYIRPLPMEETRIIDGVEVTLYDSNHCPGAVMFLFKLTSGKVILHVGDFRAHHDMESIAALWHDKINLLYLDTTYLDSAYDFLSQDEILEKCRSIANEHLSFNSNTLFLVGSYTIGKERVFKSIASELDCKIYVPPWKEKILRCLEDEEITSRLTKNKHEAKVHVVPMSEISPLKLKKYLEVHELQNSFRVLVAIKPTGWEHHSKIDDTLESLMPKQIGKVYIYGLPYSEHSSFFELRRFVQYVRPNKIIPTVNVGRADARNKMMNILKEWQKN